VTKGIGPEFANVGFAHSKIFLPTHFGDYYDEDDPCCKLSLLSLPVKWAGLAIPNPTSSAESNYDARILLCTHILAAFVVSTDGILGKEGNILLKKLSVLLAEKWKKPYSKVCGYGNAQISIAIARATHLCLRGSHILKRLSAFSDTSDPLTTHFELARRPQTISRIRSPSSLFALTSTESMKL
jgi:hypothetical protein